MSAALWAPSPARIQNTQMSRFIAEASVVAGRPLADYDDLYAWSISQPAAFYQLLWNFTEIRATPAETVLEQGDRMPGARWFPGARLNFAENLLRYRDERVALFFADEIGTRTRVTYGELYQQVARLSAALRSLGVTAGDRVVGFMPNIPETVVAMLAATSLGAIWSSCSPDFGINGVLDRFGQIQPKVLFAADGYHYAGKTLDCLERIHGIAEHLPSIEHVVVIGRLSQRPDLSALPHARHFDQLLAQHPADDIAFVALPFEHPLYILYSSGTTGVPKCIVHSAGGTLLQHRKDHMLHTDLGRDDVFFYFTTCGWMMWNWLVSGLASGATLVLFDGSPMHPHPAILWDIAEEAGITVFGTSARFISGIAKAGVVPRQSHNLSRLKTILSTGSPLAPESYDYVYRDIKQDVLLASISGGTDIVSCFALANPNGPVYRGELQVRGLGMRVEIFNDDGQPVLQEKGELVCTAPFPSMPIGFWNDADQTKYRAAYFSRFDNVWCHGDYAEITAHQGLIIYGRSDAVLNPGGVRIGTAEIYRQLEEMPEVLESLAVGQDWRDDVRVILFVKLRPGATLDAALLQTIRTRIRDNASPRHVPAKIIAVADIPRTISGKIVELAVRNVIHNQPVKNVDALANPEALALFRDLPDLQAN